MLSQWRRCVSSINWTNVVTKHHGSRVTEGVTNTLPRRYVVAKQQCCCYATKDDEKMVDGTGQEITDPFFKEEIQKYNMGKRWLAKMMGEDPDNFTQEQMDEAIEYLLPSHLFYRDARPKLKHPYTIFPIINEEKIDKTGRPMHSGFYTIKPRYSDLVYETWCVMEKLGMIRTLPDYGVKIPLDDPSNEDIVHSHGDSLLEEAPQLDDEPAEHSNIVTGDEEAFDDSLVSDEWLNKFQLSDVIKETITTKDYETLIFRLNRLANHERAGEITEFLSRFRQPKTFDESDILRDVTVYENYVRAMGYRKEAMAEIYLREGSGTITVNNSSLHEYFMDNYHREQIMYPLLLIDELDRFDIECHTIDGGKAGQSGAIRLALSRALAAWCPEYREVMENENLLVYDYRRKERKKPGRKKARRAFQWRKR